MSATLAQITADDDAYHDQCRQRVADVPSRQDLARRDAETTQALIVRLQLFLMQLLCDSGLFWYDRESDARRRLRDGEPLRPEDVMHMRSSTIAAYLPSSKKSRKCEHTLVIVLEMLPILAAAESRLRDALK